MKEYTPLDIIIAMITTALCIVVTVTIVAMAFFDYEIPEHSRAILLKILGAMTASVTLYVTYHLGKRNK